MFLNSDFLSLVVETLKALHNLDFDFVESRVEENLEVSIVNQTYDVLVWVKVGEGVFGRQFFKDSFDEILKLGVADLFGWVHHMNLSTTNDFEKHL